MKEITEKSRILDVTAEYVTATVNLGFNYKKNLTDNVLMSCDGMATQIVEEGKTPLRGNFMVRLDGDHYSYTMNGFGDPTFLINATEAVEEVVEIITG